MSPQVVDRGSRPKTLMAAATKTLLTTPRVTGSELHSDASARTAHRRLDAACLFDRVARIGYQHITRRFQFAREHESWSDTQWVRILLSGETYTSLGARDRIWVQRPEVAAYRSQFMVQGQSNFAPKTASGRYLPIKEWSPCESSMMPWTPLCTRTLCISTRSPALFASGRMVRGFTYMTMPLIIGLIAFWPGSTTMECV
jgi:hypothetical protein